ncbi:MAG TPA: DUF4198 domain-containing protein [Candidatus Krumholzibacterium sp.]|nr:DUF4198 domain-containing protein [Candidatus Krumholzibacterium sp.]
MRKKKRVTGTLIVAAWTIAALTLATGGAAAHEHWLELSSFYPETGATVKVEVCSGHDYPGSIFAVKDGITGPLTATGPGGTSSSTGTVASGKSRTASVETAQDGVWLMNLELKRPGMEFPAYEIKAILVTGSGPDDPASYALGKGLEIVPLGAISQAVKGEEIGFKVLLDGEPVGSELTVIPEKGRTAWYKTAPGEPASVPMGDRGRYLITTSVSGRGCSLVFDTGGED